MLHQVVRYAHNASRSLSAQSLQWLLTVLVRMDSITLLVLSTWPLAWDGMVKLSGAEYGTSVAKLQIDVTQTEVLHL